MSGVSYNERCKNISPELAELRMLTEVNNLRANLDEYGNVPLNVEIDTLINLETAIVELSMPFAVTTTMHKVEHMTDDAGKMRRVISWLGKHAVPLAMEGHAFHFSEAAHARVDVEVAEAKHDEETLTIGKTRAFISPKMSSKDASEDIAKAEHLFADDSIRTSRLIVDEKGQAIGREMKSLLVRGIPLEAWAAMLKDPHNIFGKSIPLRDEESALSVMEIFADLELPQQALPEGPVTIVEEVLKYIPEKASRAVVQEQLARFRGNQALYAKEAKTKAKEWFAFELELARSFESEGQLITSPIRQFMLGRLQHCWSAEELAVFASCQVNVVQNNGEYRMTDELAAVLENAKRKILGKSAAIITGNEAATVGLSEVERQKIILQQKKIDLAVATNASQAEMHSLITQRDSMLINANVKIGGGCAGGVKENSNPFDVQSLLKPTSLIGQDQEDPDIPGTWEWKMGICQVENCSSPKPTEVGPCSVCHRCQDEFDRGGDPTLNVQKSERPAVVAKKTAKPILESLFGIKQSNKKRNSFALAA